MGGYEEVACPTAYWRFGAPDEIDCLSILANFAAIGFAGAFDENVALPGWLEPGV
jgi:hypothetical protein